MPVPVPRQRAIPAVESGQAQAVHAVGGPSEEEAGRREEQACRNETTVANDAVPSGAQDRKSVV